MTVAIKVPDEAPPLARGACEVDREDSSMRFQHSSNLARALSTRFPRQVMQHERAEDGIEMRVGKSPLLDILEHPNPDRYAGQRIFVVQREDYVYLVPFVEDEHSVFLKTITAQIGCSRVTPRGTPET